MAELHLFAPATQINDATRHYVDTLAQVLHSLGRRLVHATSLAAVPPMADVLTLECKSAARICLQRPRARLWQWVQGLYPEEARWQFDSRLREKAWAVLERWTLQRSQGAVMVSQAMQHHFELKYPGLRLASVVMPCVNARLDAAAFLRLDKYTQPHFVYAGGLQHWQCIEPTLSAFAVIHRELPAATLTLLTADQQQARELVRERRLPATTVAYLPLSELPAALAAFKYGFVLREDHVVNRVATPTKVSSYMAAGVIPIMTRASQDFAQRLARTSPIIWADSLDPDEIARQVLAREAQPMDPQQVRQAFQAAFDGYLDHAAYLPALREFFLSTGLEAP